MKRLLAIIVVFTQIFSYCQDKKSQTKTPMTSTEIFFRFKQWDEKLVSLKADFSQVAIFKNADVKKETNGHITYKKPSSLKIEHFKPRKQTIITDRKKIFIVRHEDDQTYEADWQTWKKNLNSSLSSIMDFGNYSSLEEKNYIESQETLEFFILKLRNKKNPQAYLLTLFLSKEDFFPLEASLEVQDSTIKTKLTSILINQQVEDNEFKIPKTKKIEKMK